jgi:hypothetical protein
MLTVSRRVGDYIRRYVNISKIEMYGKRALMNKIVWARGLHNALVCADKKLEVLCRIYNLQRIHGFVSSNVLLLLNLFSVNQ